MILVEVFSAHNPCILCLTLLKCLLILISVLNGQNAGDSGREAEKLRKLESFGASARAMDDFPDIGAAWIKTSVQSGAPPPHSNRPWRLVKNIRSVRV